MARALALLALAALAFVPLAHADGDPASDVLLFKPTFVPPDVEIPAAYATQLNTVVRNARERGFVIRVALIGTRYDMGSVGVLYKKPEQYSRFLGQELFLVYSDRLLVVMPNGLAVSRRGKRAPADQAVVDRLAPPGANGAALASTATRAVVRLAARAGVVVPIPPLGRTPGRKDTTTQDRFTIAIAALVGVVLILGFVARRRLRH